MRFPFKLLLHKNAYVFSIFFSFILVYIPRYTQEYELRKLISREREVGAEIVVGEVIEESPNHFVLESGRYNLLFHEKPPIEVGQRLYVTGRLKQESKAESTYRITLQVQSFHQIQTKANSGTLLFFRVQKLMISIKHEILKKVFQGFSYPHSDLLLGIVMGKQISYDSSLYKSLQTSGLLHVAVASGSNIVIIATILFTVISRVIRGRLKIITALIVLFIYSGFTGFDPSICRALLMFSTLLVARAFGRPTSSNLAFFYTIMLLVVFEPFLVYSASFLLSVSATASLLWWYPLYSISQEGSSGNAFTLLWEDLKISYFTTISVLIFTVPLQIDLFGSLNIIGLVSNMLIGPLLTPIMVLGIIYIAISSSVLGVLSGSVSFFLWFLLEVFVRIINLISLFPYATIPITNMTFMGAVFYYIVLALGVRWVCSRKIC